MPQPSPSDVHVDSVLTALSVKYANDRDSYIAGKVFPTIPVQNQSDIYYKFNKGDWFRLEAQKRAPATVSAGGGYTLTTDNYFCDPWAIHKDVDDQTVANTDAPLNAFRNATEWVTDQLLLRRDAEWANAFMQTGIWATDRQGVGAGPTGDQFVQFDAAGAVPIDEVHTDVKRIHSATGKRPNVLVIGADVEYVLKDHSTILDRIKYTQPGMISLALLAAAFDVERVVVADAIYNTAAEGATETMSYIVNSKSMLLAYAAPTAAVENVSAGYTFAWTGLHGSNATTGRVSRFRIEERKADRVEAEANWDMKAVATDCAVFYYDVVS